MDVLTVIAIIGGIALLVGLFGGGIQARDIKIPKLPNRVRFISSLIGFIILIFVSWRASLNAVPIPPNPTPTVSPNPPGAISTTIPPLTPTPIFTLTSTAISTLSPTPSPVCVIEDFENSRRGIWWSPDSNVFSYQETNKQAINSNLSLIITYIKSDTFQFIAFEPERGLCSFNNGNNFHVWVYGEVTLLLKLEDSNGNEFDIGERSASISDDWTLLEFNYADAVGTIDLGDVKNIKLFPMPGNASASGVFYLDDLSIYP